MLIIMLFLLESLTWLEIAGGAVTILISLALLKSGVLQQLTTSTSSLLTNRTTERDDALREKDRFKFRVEELEKEALVLRREITQQYVIAQLDRKKYLDIHENGIGIIEKK